MRGAKKRAGDECQKRIDDITKAFRIGTKYEMRPGESREDDEPRREAM